MSLGTIEVTGFKSIRELKLQLRPLNSPFAHFFRGLENFNILYFGGLHDSPIFEESRSPICHPSSKRPTETRSNFQLVNSLETKLPNLRISFQNKRTVSLNVLIGANGAGKSNFILLFKLLNEMVEQRFQLFVRQQGGANAFLHFGQKSTEQITVSLAFAQNAYDCVWVPTVDDRLIFAQERCWFFGGNWTEKSRESLGSGHEESKLPRFAKPGCFRSIPDHVYNSLISWKVYHFHDTSDSAPIKRTSRRFSPRSASVQGQGYSVFEFDADESQCPRWLGGHLATGFRDVRIACAPQQSNRRVA